MVCRYIYEDLHQLLLNFMTMKLINMFFSKSYMMCTCLMHFLCRVSNKDMHYYHQSFFSYALHSFIKKVQKLWEELQLNRTHELPCCADDINFLIDVILSTVFLGL